MNVVGAADTIGRRRAESLAVAETIVTTLARAASRTPVLLRVAAGRGPRIVHRADDVHRAADDQRRRAFLIIR